MLHPPAGPVAYSLGGGYTYVIGRPEWAPPFEHVQLSSAAEVDALAGPPEGHDLVGLWAWEERGTVVRVRVFAPRLGVLEDEATGAYAVRLCARLGQEVEIHQGVGSLILARPEPDGGVRIGGKVELVEEREYPV